MSWADETMKRLEMAGIRSLDALCRHPIGLTGETWPPKDAESNAKPVSFSGFGTYGSFGR